MSIYQFRKFVQKYGRCIILVTIIGCVFFLLNCLTPYFADDFHFSVDSKNMSIIDILYINCVRYFTTIGRIPGHVFIMTVMKYDKIIFNIVNTLVYLAFTYLIYFHSTCGVKLNKRWKLLFYLMVHILLFIYTIEWGQIFLWVSGACNYLWTCTVMLLFLVPFRYIYVHPFYCFSKKMTVVMALLGLLAGWCNENTSGGVVLLAYAYILCFVFQEKKVPVWMNLGAVSATIAYILMLASPGNAKRKSHYVNNSAWYNQIIKNFKELTNQYVSNYKYLIFALIITIIILGFVYKGKKIFIGIAMHLMASLAISYALVLSPYRPGRALFGGLVFLIIAFTYAAALVTTVTERGKILLGSYIGILTFTAVVSFSNAFIDMAYYKVHSDRRDRFVEEQKKVGMTNIVVNDISPAPQTKYNAAFHLNMLKNNPYEWPSDDYANYCGVNTITSVPEDLWRKVFLNGNVDLINCRDIYEYLQMVNDPKYLVLMAVNDESSGAIDDEIVRLMKLLGLKTDLRENYRWSYLAVINQGKVVDEKYDNKVLNYYGIIDGHSVEIESSGKIYNKGNRASIKIDGYEYSHNSIGLNIVVFDSSKARVVDRVTFNTWKGLEASR